MKIPRVTVEFDEEDTETLGKMSPALVGGFSVRWGWVYILLFSTVVMPAGTSPYVSLEFAVYSLATIVTTFCYGFFLKNARRLFSTPELRSRNRFIAATATALGILVFMLLPTSVIAAVVGAVLMGIGSAILLMSYGVSFSVCDLPAATACTAISMGFGAAIFACVLALGMSSSAFVSVFMLVAPFIECGCLKVASRQLVDNLEFTQFTIPVKTPPFAIHVIIPCLVLGFAAGLICIYAFTTLGALPFDSMVAPTLFAAGACFLLILLAIYTQHHISNFIFRTMTPVVAVMIAYVDITNAADPWWTVFCLFGSYLLLEACLWVVLADIAQRFRISAFTVFGFGLSARNFGTFLAFIPTLIGGGGTLPVDLHTFTCIIFVAMMFGVAILPRTSELRNALKIGKNCLGLRTDEEIVQEEIDQNLQTPLEATASGDGVPAATGETRADGAAHADGEGAAAAPGAQVGDTAHAAAQGTATLSGTRAAASGEASSASAAAGSRDGTLAAADDEEAAASRRRSTDAEIAESVAEAAKANMTAEQLAKAKQGRFKRKCAAVASTYMLSMKETEVLYLLAKGYNSAMIQESLYIAAGTANTHMRHIYRKLDIHSQQELINLVESAEVEDIDL